MTIGTVLLLILGFVVVNALFVAAEFALIASPRPSLERRSARGDRLAGRVLEIQTSPRRQDRYVATAQLGITLSSLGLGMYGEHALARLLEGWLGRMSIAGEVAIAATLTLGALTVVHIVVGEMLPKGLALQNPERVAGIAHWPMQVVLVVLYPFVALSNGLSRLCLRLVGIRRQENTREMVYTPEELQLIVEESQRGGMLRGEAGRILSSCSSSAI